MALKFDFDEGLKNLIQQVDEKLQKCISGNESYTDWLLAFPAKAKQKLLSNDGFKMPKTPGRKKAVRQQKKRVLNEGDEHANQEASDGVSRNKREKLFHDEEEFQESVGGRPRRQASNAAKSKIQQSLKMMNLTQKLRRPSGEETSGEDNNTSSVHDSSTKLQPPFIEEEPSSSILTRFRQPVVNYREFIVASTEVIEPAPTETVNGAKVQFAPEPKWRSSELDHASKESSKDIKVVSVEASPHSPLEEVIQVKPPKKGRPRKKAPEAASTSEEPEEQHAEATLRTRKTKKGPEVDDVEAVVQDKPCSVSRKTKRSGDVSEDMVSTSISYKKRSKESDSNEKELIGLPEANMANQEEKSNVPIASKETSVEPVIDGALRASIASTYEVKVAKETTALETIEVDSKRATYSKLKKPAKELKSAATVPTITTVTSPRNPQSSKAVRDQPMTPSRRNILDQASKFTSPASSPARKPFLVFSPFKASSVKTKVEAFEAVLSSGGGAKEGRIKAQSTVLPEARVLLRRLTNEDLKDAGIVPESPGMEIGSDPNNGTFVVEEPTKPIDKRSVTQVLARKSIGKAKLTAITAARNKLAQNVLPNEGNESPNVHLNLNAANLMSKFRFNNTGGSSSSSSVRHVAMTQARALTNVVSGLTSFSTTNKPMLPLVTKSSDDEGQKRKELELRRLKEKEEEAARKRDELLRAKAEEQKKKHDARSKRAMEQRALKAKQADEEQKQKLESKEEKSAHLKMKLQVETQEKAERKRAEILQRQQEAEQRRKAEELQKQREEEQQRLIKKEQEELVPIKVKNEVDKTKIVTGVAGPSNLNATVTLTSPAELIDTYQITPVRVKKVTTKKVPNPDNYDISDMRSDDSTDDDSKPKKVIPLWARSVNVKAALANQVINDISDSIFPAEILLVDPDLNVIFKHKRPRFDKRTSSAVWKTPPANYM